MSTSTLSKPAAQRAVRAPTLSPRRKVYAQRLLEFVNFHGRKLILNEAAYTVLASAHRLDRVQADQAADDLYALGLCGASMAGDTMILYAVGSGEVLL